MELQTPKGALGLVFSGPDVVRKEEIGEGTGHWRIELAAKWFERAASQGHARSQFEIGLHYAYGCGVEQDLAKAEEWILMAVRNGQVEAELSLKGVQDMKQRRS